MKHTKIAIIGAGNVGSTIAYACILQNICAEIILIDIQQDTCRGQVIDLEDALAQSYTSGIKTGSFEQAAHADIILICAGANQKIGQSRSDLITTNKNVIASIFASLGTIQDKCIIIMVTNPLDALTRYAQQISSHPQHLIFGSGTYLDSQRLCTYLSQKISIAPESINAYMIGEHGDSAFPAWSCARIGGSPLASFAELHPDALEAIAQKARAKAYDIIKLKCATYFGIAACVTTLCKAIISDRKSIFPLSVYHREHDICFSMPAILGASGIEKTLSLPLNKKEEKLLSQSIEKIKSDMQELGQ